MEEIILTLPEDKVYTLDVKKYWYGKKDDPYGLYTRDYGYDNAYDFEWKPDEDAWE